MKQSAKIYYSVYLLLCSVVLSFFNAATSHGHFRLDNSDNLLSLSVLIIFISTVIHINFFAKSKRNLKVGLIIVSLLLLVYLNIYMFFPDVFDLSSITFLIINILGLLSGFATFVFSFKGK